MEETFDTDSGEDKLMTERTPPTNTAPSIYLAGLLAGVTPTSLALQYHRIHRCAFFGVCELFPLLSNECAPFNIKTYNEPRQVARIVSLAESKRPTLVLWNVRPPMVIS